MNCCTASTPTVPPTHAHSPPERTMSRCRTHRRPPRPVCASGYPPTPRPAGLRCAASKSASAAGSPTSPATCPTTKPSHCAGYATAAPRAPGASAIYRARPRRVPRQRPTLRTYRGHPRRSTRLRLRPLPQRPHRLATRNADELTGRTTSTTAVDRCWACLRTGRPARDHRDLCGVTRTPRCPRPLA